MEARECRGQLNKIDIFIIHDDYEDSDDHDDDHDDDHGHLQVHMSMSIGDLQRPISQRRQSKTHQL